MGIIVLFINHIIRVLVPIVDLLAFVAQMSLFEQTLLALLSV